MSIAKKNKDHLKEHGGVALVPPSPPISGDPLQFWTNHHTENTFIDLTPFANGELKNPRLYGGGGWPGPFTGRPTLIAELAPAIEACCAMRRERTVRGMLVALRAWWRIFDTIEAISTPEGRPISRVSSIADLGFHHEAAGHRLSINQKTFLTFIRVVNAARALRRMPPLGWIAPCESVPIRNLIPDDQAREIRTVLKQDWERVRKTWALNDKVRAEAERRARGGAPQALDKEEARRLDNWRHLQEMQQKHGVLVPSGKQLLGHFKNEGPLIRRGLSRLLMRSMAFPTVEEADIAFHLALANSGWNPSTMQRIDPTTPFLLTNHPKDDQQLVLMTDVADTEDAEGDEVTLHADKPRAGGATQYCTGKRSQPSSAPMVVEAYLRRVELLRDFLRQDAQSAQRELDLLRVAGADPKSLAKQIKLVQKLEAGCRSVWLYVDREGNVSWINLETSWNRYKKVGCKKTWESYLDRVRERINHRRTKQRRPLILKVTPSDFRDLYARWVYKASNGNILAVMLALGHRRIASTAAYLENNIFSVENDEKVRRWGVHLFNELGRGRLDLTILAQLLRHGQLTPEMETRLAEYRQLMRSRVGVGCADPRRPPLEVAPHHIEGQLCGTHRCLKKCPNARFLPESLDGTAMRIEELLVMMERLPRETWLRGGFDEELELSEALLQELFSKEAVADARFIWRARIAQGEHLIPGLGRIEITEVVA